MNDKLLELTNSHSITNPHYNKKKLIFNKNEASVSRIILVNCILDFKSFFKKNFKDSKKGYLGLGLITFYFLNKKRPFIYNIKNNYEFSNSLITKNKLIKVNPVRFPNEKKFDNNNTNHKNNNNLRFTYSYEYKHINNLYNKLFRFRNIHNEFKNPNNLNDVNNSVIENIPNKENISNDQEKKELEVLSGIEVKLCGIKDINEEGKLIMENLIYDKNSQIYLQFNHILYMDTPELYCWVYIKNKKFTFNKINLNLLLVKQGLANANQVKLNDVYDERIYYNYADLLDAERNAKEKGMGIWSDKRSKVVRESSIKNERFGSFFDKLAKRLNMRSWEKSLLNK